MDSFAYCIISPTVLFREHPPQKLYSFFSYKIWIRLNTRLHGLVLAWPGCMTVISGDNGCIP